MLPQKISQNLLARTIKVPPRRINEIVQEKRAITADTAVRLAIFFGGSATYWLHLQSEYEISKIKDHIKIQLSTVQASHHASIDTPANNNSSYSPATKPHNKSGGNVKKRIMR